MSSRNANRIMSDMNVRKNIELEHLNLLPQQQRKLILESEENSGRRATLDSLLAISKAREQGLIKKRNVLKIDEKVNKCVSKIIRCQLPQLKITLPEQMKLLLALSVYNKQMCQLPAPRTSRCACSLKHMRLLSRVPKDLLHWQSLPEEVKNDEIERI